ncbi:MULTISPECIES: helix-turn-helix domain-containing protein [Paenibacillus]|uniref:helix-turn-helix domain-containing protein n=1 Tax=Paenibacillus TaxID=44249 RepID=UPI00187B22F9|nr:helix-turn-helix domain-containing protein [Paenibacillus sp. P13VS]MBE7682056.1 helix-turn-helix domain-containing protein [Paenibacillus sp. P13VS]MBM6385667.1 helix-turn-helix transcriptional regulator [Paenibacillus sp.]
MDLAEKILELMDEQGITKYRLSKETGVSYTGLTKILSGQTKHPQVDSLQAIANFFSKPLDYFMDQEEEKPSPDWATPKDLADIKKILEEDQPVLFDGVPITDEKRQRAMDILTGLLWEAKELNKETYGRKKKANPKDKE